MFDKWNLRGHSVTDSVNRSAEVIADTVQNVADNECRVTVGSKAAISVVEVDRGAARHMSKASLHRRALQASVNKWLCLFAFMVLGPNAAAQTIFSFAGLAWGDSIQTVDSKLEASGFSGCTVSEKLDCSLRTSCNCRFTAVGPTVSYVWAYLSDNKLESVEVGVHSQEWSNTIDQLRKKYSNPFTCPVVTKRKWDLDDVCWKSSNGESLDTTSGIAGSKLIYKSAVKNQKDQVQDQANKSVF